MTEPLAPTLMSPRCNVVLNWIVARCSLGVLHPTSSAQHSHALEFVSPEVLLESDALVRIRAIFQKCSHNAAGTSGCISRDLEMCVGRPVEG